MLSPNANRLQRERVSQNSWHQVPDLGLGPWDVIASIKGEAPHYEHWYKVRERVNAHYPRVVPEVRFLGTILHAFINENRILSEVLASFCREGFPLSDVLATCQLLLQSADAMEIEDPPVRQAFEAGGKQNARRLAVLKAYSPKHPELHGGRFQARWLDPRFLAAHRAGTRQV